MFLENFSFFRWQKDMTIIALSTVFWIRIVDLMQPSDLKKQNGNDSIVSKLYSIFSKQLVKLYGPENNCKAVGSNYAQRKWF